MLWINFKIALHGFRRLWINFKIALHGFRRLSNEKSSIKWRHSSSTTSWSTIVVLVPYNTNLRANTSVFGIKYIKCIEPLFNSSQQVLYTEIGVNECRMIALPTASACMQMYVSRPLNAVWRLWSGSCRLHTWCFLHFLPFSECEGRRTSVWCPLRRALTTFLCLFSQNKVLFPSKQGSIGITIILITGR